MSWLLQAYKSKGLKGEVIPWCVIALLRKCMTSWRALKRTLMVTIALLLTQLMQFPICWLQPMPSTILCESKSWIVGTASMPRRGRIPFWSKSCSSFVPTSTLKVWKHIFKLTHLHLKFGNTFLLRFCLIFFCEKNVVLRSWIEAWRMTPWSCPSRPWSAFSHCPALLWLWCYNMHGFTM